MITRNKIKSYLFVMFILIVIYSSIANAKLEQFPTTITIAVTGFTDAEKADCPGVVTKYGNGSVETLDIYINNRINEGASGFSKQTLNFKTYVKDVLPKEWMAGFWGLILLWRPESLNAGAMAAKLASWFTINDNYPLMKWPHIGAHVVDFTCDQMYENNSNTNDGNDAVDYTWDYYAIYNGTGTEKVLNAAYIAGQIANKSKGDGTYMTQWGSQYWALTGKVWEWMFDYYYDDIFLAKNIQIGDSVSARIADGQTWKFYLTLNGNEEGFKIDPFFSLSYLQLKIINPNNQVVTQDLSTSYTKSLTITKPQVQAGNWTIEVYASSVTGKYGDFDITTKLIDTSPEDVAQKTGGINFTSLNLNYINTCDGNELSFVMKGKEAQAGDTIINITNATVNAMDYFLTGLVIPDDKIWITMDVIPGNGPLGYLGTTAKVHPELKQTRLGQALLGADVKLKFDQFGQAAESHERNMLQEWINSVQASPYWSQIQTKNFNTYPKTLRRTWIYPQQLEAEGDGCTVYLTNLTLNISYVFDFAALDLSAYSFSPEIVNDLNSRLAIWKSKFLDWHYANVTNTTVHKINTAPEYQELRSAAASLAIAQWYKKQDLSQIPFGDIINSNNISGLNLNFDQTYWDGQAWQYLYTLPNSPSFLPGNWWWDFYGGVVLSAVDPDITGTISNQTENLMKNATLYSYVQENEAIYFSTVKNPEKSDLVPVALGFSALTPDANTTINITVAVRNEGELASNNFKVKYSYIYTYPNGYTANYLIGIQEVGGLAIDEVKLVSILANVSLIGAQNISVEIDYNNSVEEINELNNMVDGMIEVVGPKPAANLISPANGQQAKWDEIIVFAGYGTDYKDGEITQYNWTSSKDGYLGNDSLLYTNLSLGNHIVYLTVKDSESNIDTAQVLISVIPGEPPAATLSSPSNGQIFKEGEIIYFSGSALDHEDGALIGNSLLWNSSIVSLIGSGNSFSLNYLLPGIHNITLTAVDSSGIKDTELITISIEESTPNVTIIFPANNTQFYSNQNNITFNGTATDPHQGDLSAQVNWTSSINGNLGKGPLLTKVLSAGTHLISAFVTDELGLSGLAQIYLTVLEPLPPTVSIISPSNNKGIINGNSFTFKGSGTDPETGTLTNNSLVWNSSLDGNIGNSTELTLNSLTVGVHEITLTAIDQDSLTAQAKVNLTVSSALPVVTIFSPSQYQVFSKSAVILFNGTATDYEDGGLNGTSLQWTSNLNGFLGDGNLFSISNLSLGTHTLILNATDSHGKSTLQTKQIVIVDLDSAILTAFSDDSSNLVLNYSSPSQKVVYIKLPKNANITSATLQIQGLSNEE